MFCQHCGTQIPDDAKFCPECGVPVSANDQVHDKPPDEKYVAETSGDKEPEKAAQDDDAFKILGIPLQTCNQIDMHLAKGKKAAAIRLYKQATGASSDDANAFIEDHRIGYWPFGDGEAHIEELYAIASAKKASSIDAGSTSSAGGASSTAHEARSVKLPKDESISSHKNVPFFKNGLVWFLIVIVITLFIAVFISQENINSATDKSNTMDRIYNDGIIGFINTNNFSLEYNDHEFAENTFGTKCLVVYFNFMNLSNEDQKFTDVVDVVAYQGGVKLDFPLFSPQSRETFNSSSIRSNAEVLVCKTFSLLSDSTDDIEITVALKPSSKIIDHMFIPYKRDMDFQMFSDSVNKSVENGTVTAEETTNGKLDKEEKIEAAPLSDFYLNLNDDSTISLKAYETHNEDCYISETYIVDGRKYYVTKIDDACFFGRTSLKNVSIPEGVTFIAHNAFNSCSVENLYLPSTLNDMTGVYEYLTYNRLNIYYAGTENQWNLIKGANNAPSNFNIHFSVPVVDVIDDKNYNSQDLTLEKSAAEELGGALGNAFNGFISGMLDELGD